jgi:DNA-binding transcriptional MocR family regulator
MSAQRRRHLIDLAGRCRVPVLEDDAYGLLNYGSPPPPPLASMDRAGIVIYLSTLSKMLCPGLRLGWMAVPPEFSRLVSGAKQLTDLHTNNLLQRAVDLYIRKGLLQQHLEEVKPAYTIKRDTMIKTLEEYAPPGVSWNRPQGGFYIWASLPGNLSSVQLLQEAVKKRVSFVAGPAFHPNGEGSNMLRLNFTYAPAGAVKHGIKTLCVVIKELLERDSRAEAVFRKEYIPIV